VLILKGFKKFIFLLKIKFDTIEYLNKLKKNNSYFHTFINKKSLAVGVIFLKPGENDTQEPHDSDEIYYILDGNGFLQINDKSHRIKKEEIYFVAKEPKTRSGKIMRRLLKSIASNDEIGDISTLEDGSAVEEVQTAFDELQKVVKKNKN